MIAFNGEIYNYPEIMQILKDLGHSFSTRSDTEVILRAYLEWGDQCLEYFEGMFAFVIFDPKKGRLYCARDHFGQKPLYYFESNDLIILSSLPQLIVHLIKHNKIYPLSLNKFSLFKYLTLGYIADNQTLFNEIIACPAAEQLSVDLKSSTNFFVQRKQYWNLLEPNFTRLAPSSSDLSLILDRGISNIFTLEVPAGLLLSHGVDSSLVAAYMPSGNSAFTLNRDTDDIESINNYVSNFDLRHTIIDAQSSIQSLEDRINSLQVHLTAPQAFSSLLSLDLLLNALPPELKVAVCGDGADEINLGYDWYDAKSSLDYVYQFAKTSLSVWHKKYNSIYFKSPLHRHVLRTSNKYFPQDICHLFDLTDNESFDLYISSHEKYFDFSDGSYVRKCATSDLANFCTHHGCVKIDSVGMKHQTEIRLPLLDPNLYSHMYKYFAHAGYDKKERFVNLIQNKIKPKLFKPGKKTGFSRKIYATELQQISFKSSLENYLDLKSLLTIASSYPHMTATLKYSLLMLDSWFYYNVDLA